MTSRKNPQTPAVRQAPAGAAGEPCEPRPPVVAQGDRSPSAPLLGAAPKGSPDGRRPGAEGSRSQAAGIKLQTAPGAPQGDAEGRKRWQAALSASAGARRNQRDRPWSRRDPLRNAVPGARKMPPGGDR